MNEPIIDPARLITRDRPGCPEWAKGVMKQIRVRASDTDPECKTDYIEGWFKSIQDNAYPFFVSDDMDETIAYSYIQPVLKPMPWIPEFGEQVIAWSDNSAKLSVGELQEIDDEGSNLPYMVNLRWYAHIGRMRPIDASTTPEDIMRGEDWR